ncbi:Nucleolar protein 6 [Dirofilaria immitis]|nr:Nucleolar protein 6 [Dirofilaria immitis]
MKRKGDDTLEEINREREKRRLICMQIDDYIEEIKLSNVEKCKLETLAESVKSAIYAAKEAEVAYQMDDLQELNLGKIRFPFSLPFGLELNNVKSSCGCRWIHPDKIDALGNWRIGHRTKIDPILDLIIIIPQNYFGSRDYLNFAYFVKRAHYICQVARILVDTGFSVKFGLDYFDTLKPLLFVSNKNESESDGFLRIHFAPPRDFTKISRFRPENNNLRPSFVLHILDLLVSIDTPTPVYNSKILIDMLREELEAKHEAFSMKNQPFKSLHYDTLMDASKGFHPVSTNWKESRVGLCDNDTLYSQFSSHCDFIFLDHTGYLNLAISLSVTAIEEIRAAATDAITKMNTFNQQVTLRKSTTNEVALLIGFRLSTKWNNLLTRGPPAKSSDAVHFRQFWGDICELRRFPDNAICEAVVWDSSNVTVLICQHILQRHLKLEASNVEERTLKMEEILPNALDRYSTIARAYDKLSQILHMVQDLPLLITNIHPVSAYLRRTAPFPPLSTNAIIEGHSAFIKDSVAFPLSHISPPYLPTVEVQITMEQSGKWGEELNAIARLKTAFYVELSKILKEKHSLQAIPFDDYLIVHFNTVVFRLIIANPKEVHIMRKLNGGKTGVPKDSPTSKLKELEVILKPQLTALLHSASQRFEAFADTCRLAIYWLSSHALSDYLNEMILETIVAYIFLKPFSVQPPRTPFIGFFHFLTLLSTHNWLMKPLFVDFDNEWTETDIDEIEKEFIKMRPVLPVMVICTPVDRSGYRWTREEPQPLILKRLIALSKASAALIEQHINNLAVFNLKGLFTTDISSFSNVIIHIRGRHKVRRKVVRGKLINGPLPVIDYDPIRVYVKRLRQSFSSVALFFYNKYKGNMIGVAWKPDALLPRDASISKCLHRLKRSDNKLVVNIKAILDDFMILGQGLVREVTQNLAVEDDENMEN